MTLEPPIPNRMRPPPTMATWEHVIPHSHLRAIGAPAAGVTLLACFVCNAAKGAALTAPTALILDAADFFRRYVAWSEAHADQINIAHMAKRNGRRAKREAERARAAFLRKTERRNAGVQTAIGPRCSQGWISVDGVRYTPAEYSARVAAKRKQAQQDQARWEREQRRVLSDQIAMGNRR